MADNVAGPDDVVRAEVEEARSLLTSGRWQEARQRLRAMAREYPGQAVVLEALGDCYAAGNRWRESVYWYERSIDQRYDPSVANRLRTAREHLGGEAPRGTTARTIAAVVLSFVVLAGAIVVLIVMSQRQRLPSHAMQVGAPAPVLQRGQASAPALPAAPSGVGRPVSVLPPRPAPRAQTPAVTAETPQAGMASAGQPPTQPAPSYPIHITEQVQAPETNGDYYLTQALNALTWPDGTPMSRGALVQTDPPMGHALVTLTMPQALPTADLANAAINGAYAAAVAVVKNGSRIYYVTVRILYNLAGRGDRPDTVVAFRGDLTRDTIYKWQQAQGAPGTEVLWRQIFTGPWWNPDVPATTASSQTR